MRERDKITYEFETQQLREEYQKIDLKDPEEVRNWFKKYPHLRTTDHAIIADRSPAFIRDLKKKVGLGTNIKSVPPRPIPELLKTVTNIDVPEDWDNKEWLTKMSKTHSMHALSKAIGVDRGIIKRRYIKYGIPIKTPKEARKSTNPCCTKEWVYRHYVEQRLSLRECSRLAGISKSTFSKWLVRFGYPTRRKNEKINALWFKELAHKLEQQPIVRRIYLGEDHIHVRFYNFYWETYYPYKTNKLRSYGITPDSSKIEEVPQVVKQYEEAFGEEKHASHITMQMDKWKKATFIERRLCVHEFMRQMLRRGWMDPNYPDYIIQEELEFLRNIKSTKYIRGNNFNAYPPQVKACRKLAEQYFDYKELWPLIKKPYWSCRITNNMVSRAVKQYDTHEYYRSAMYMLKEKEGIPKIINLGFYKALLERLNINGTVLDLTPNHGSKAMACAVKDITYMTEPSEKMQIALERGVSERTGLRYEEYNGGKVDLVIMDNDLRDCDANKIMEYTSIAKHMLLFVRRSNKREYEAKYKPASIIPIKAKYYSKVPDFLFWW